uniref:Rhophilin 2 n=1 Tax=Echinococcus granulosus TaxID=6210 RepID=A0A068WUM6_ECHGR|nr:rhophilin 2 [Echinococcus granulosus]
MDCLNSEFATYQNLESRLPVIPIGLKDTHFIDFKTHFSSFIVSHYHEDPGKFSEALNRLTLSRSKVTEPQRSANGLRDFRAYYNLLNTIERRFFDESVHHGFRFSWSDAFTGEQHNQRSPAFEKGSLIFNYAALCSQIAAACSTESADALSEQTRWFVQARANLQVLRESFAHAPSRDMSPELLGFLIQVMQLQAQESVFLRQMLECQNDSEVAQLIKYIGGASFLSEGYGKVASPTASTYDDLEGSQVTMIIPFSWLKLLEVKSQYYQAQINHKLAIVLICLATNGKMPDAGPFEVKPLPVEGLFSNDGFLDAEVGRQLNELFVILRPYIKLHRQTPRASRRHPHHRRRRYRSIMNNDAPRPVSRIKRTLSSLSLSGLGRGKSRASEDLTYFSDRSSSLSMRSGYSSDSAFSMPNLAGIGGDLEGELVAPPSNRKDAHLLGRVCLAEALSWAQMALQSIEQSSDLNREANLKAFVSKDVDMCWAEQLDRLTKGNSNSNTVPVKKPRKKWLFGAKSFNRSSSNVDTASVISTTSTMSKKSLSAAAAAKKAEGNPWSAPTFLPAEIELPKNLSYNVLKSGKNMLTKGEDPFRDLGPLRYFNAQKRWSQPYTVQLARDEKVVYGFSIQGTGPVEILGVDADTPASENGMRTGDLVVSINGMDARFMTHNEAVAAIRFGVEGYDRAIRAQAAAAAANEVGENGEAAAPVTFPLEVDVVKLTLLRPIPPEPKPVSRRPSIYLATPDTPAREPITPKTPNPIKSFMRRSKSKPRPPSRHNPVIPRHRHRQERT